MAVYTYTLDAISSQFGAFAIDVSSTVDAGYPNHQTLIGIELSEMIDFAAGDLGDMVLTLTVEEDTDAVAAGWWATVLSGDASLTMTLDDGTGAAYVFSGEVLKSELSAREYSTGTPKVRMWDVKCRSLLGKLAGVSIVDLITELESHMVTDDGETGKFVKITDVIASALSLAFSQTFDSTYVSLQDDGGNDLLFTNTGTVLAWSVDQVYWMMQINDSGYAHQGYTDSTSEVYWGTTYSDALELVRAICANFAVVPQYYYDTATSKHKIRLLQKGRCYTGTITLPEPITSTYNPSGGIPLKSALVSDWDDEARGWVWINGVDKLLNNVTSPGYALPESWQPDIKIGTLWNFAESFPWASTVEEWETLYGIDVADVSWKVDKVTIYDYSTAGTTAYTTSTNRPFCQALLDYIKLRYYAEGLQEYKRTLSTLVPTGGVHDDLKLMVRTTIGSDTFTVTELIRNYLTGQTKVTLLELS